MSTLQTKSASKTEATIALISTLNPTPPRRILVVGCGAGQEAGLLARAFQADTVGIDLGDQFAFDHAGAAPAVLTRMDARDLRFDDASFDLVFSFHAVEHIPQPALALNEMARVLRPRGGYFIGTPNKSRLLGYIGSASSLRSKVMWNLNDFAMRARGKWTNEDGAHAGFTATELLRLCTAAFGDGWDATDAYYRTLYARNGMALDMLSRSGLDFLIYPCVYVVGTKMPAPPAAR